MIRHRPRTAARQVPAALVALALLASQADLPAAHAAAAPEHLLVVTDINYPPYLFRNEDGQLQGILKDKWELWSRRNRVPVQLVGMEWSKAQESVQNGSADVIEALAYTPARVNLYEFSPAYAPIEARVYFHRSISGISDVASMRGFTLGAKDGSACASWLRERGVTRIRPYPSSEVLVRAAGAGEVRLFCMDSPVAQYLLFKLGLAEDFRETPPLYSAEFHWAVKKLSSAGVEEGLVRKVEACRILLHSGEI